MASTLEQLTVVGVPFNSDAGPLVLDQLKFTPAEPRPQFVGGSDADGEILSDEVHYGNATFEGMLQVEGQASMDAALAQVATFHAALLELERAGGSVVWTPAGSNRPMTFDGLQGQIGDLPIDMESGWLHNAPQVGFHLTCAPFWRDVPIDTVTEAFGSNVIADYDVDAGAAANVSITGGVMQAAANLTTENRFIRARTVPYPDLYDAQSTLKPNPGTTLSGFKAGVILKRTAANTYVEVYVDDNGTNSRLRIDKIVAGARTNVQSTNLAARIATSTAFWVRGRIEGNIVYAEYWTAAPTNTGTATLAPAGVTLAGADATALGQGVKGRYGLVFLPQQAGAALDDWVLEPNVWISTSPAVVATIPATPGTVKAAGRLIVVERSGQARRFVEWGMEQLYTNLSAPLVIDSAAFAIAGYAGVTATPSGANGGSVVRATLTPTVVACLSTGDQPHVGTFRVKARVAASSPSVSLRFAWQDGDGPIRAGSFVTPPVSGQTGVAGTFAYAEVDLGTITVSPALLGAQKWSGRVEAMSTASGDTLDVDFLVLVPVSEGYGKARAQLIAETPTAFSARDEFDQIAGGLNGKVAPAGGTWAGAGAATDFTVDATVHSATRTNSTDAGDPNAGRFMTLSATTLADAIAAATITHAKVTGVGSAAWTGPLLRYIDANNWLWGFIRYLTTASAPTTTMYYEVRKRVAGVTTLLAQIPFSSVAYAVGQPYNVRLYADAAGRWAMWVYLGTNPGMPVASGVDSALATGGALASGKVGFCDYRESAAPVLVDNFLAAVPTARNVLFSGSTLEIRHDDVQRADAAGAAYGQPPAYRGSRFAPPSAGPLGRTTRVLVKADRNDIESFEKVPLGDKLQAQAILSPRFIAPR